MTNTTRRRFLRVGGGIATASVAGCLGTGVLREGSDAVRSPDSRPTTTVTTPDDATPSPSTVTPDPTPTPDSAPTPDSTVSPGATATPDPRMPAVEFGYDYDPATERLTVRHAGGDPIRDAVTTHLSIDFVKTSRATFWASDRFPSHGEFPVREGDSVAVSVPSGERRVQIQWANDGPVGWVIDEHALPWV